MDAVVRPSSGSIMIGSSQFTSTLARLNMDGDSDSERSDRVVSSLVAGPALLQFDDTADAVTDEDADDDDEDDYEFQDDYVYDISSRLREVNVAHFAESLPPAKENRVRFAEDPVDRVFSYSPTPLADVDERLQLKKEYLMKLFAKDDSEIGDNQSDESDLFSSSDDDDFVDRNIKTPSPIVEIPRTPSPTKDGNNHEANNDREGYSSDDETEEGCSVDGEEYDTSTSTTSKSQTITAATAATNAIPAVKDNSSIDPELDSKIMELIERSVRSSEYQAGSDAAKHLGSQIRSTIQESLKKEPQTTKAISEANAESSPATPANGDVDSVHKEDETISSAESNDIAMSITANGGGDTCNNISSENAELERQDDAKLEGGATPSPEPPAVTLNDSTRNMVTQSSVDRQTPPKDLAIKSPQVAAKSATSSPSKPLARKPKSPPTSPKRSVASPKRAAQSPVGSNAIDRLTAPASNPVSFPPSPTRFIRKSTGTAPPDANDTDQRPRPASSTGSSSETTTPVEKETRKLPAYTGNDRSRYGLPLAEKVKLKEQRERIKREKEERAQREEDEKRKKKQDAQKTFEAWLRNKNVELENSKKIALVEPAAVSSRKKTLSPQPPAMDESQHEASPSPSTTVTFLTWLKGKQIQEKQRKLQEKLQQIEIEELERKHTRQDAQQAYKRWLRRKALESEQRRISQRQRAVEERLSSSSSKSKEVLDRFFESEHFASLTREQQDNDLQQNATPATVNGGS